MGVDRGRSRTATVDRGQAHTLEAFSAGVVLLASVLFALQVTAVTPLTASTASQHIENQQAGVAGGVLDAAAENGSLERTVLYWNNSSAGSFHGASDEGYYQGRAPNTTFGHTLNETFIDRGIAVNMQLHYAYDNTPRQVIVMGTPSDNAVTVHRSLTLYDDDPLYRANETRSNATVKGSTYDVPEAEADSGSPVYNVVKVELTVWRM